jgi:hypothetical protein
MRMGKLANGGQFGTGTQGAVIYHLAKSPHDLGDQSDSGLGIEYEHEG